MKDLELPEEFVSALRSLLGGQFDAFTSSLTGDASHSIRMNPGKLDLSLPLPVIPWSNQGYYLVERPLFTADPLYHAGAYYVQEASSMFLEQAVKAMDLKEGVVGLDLCGAPGGKATHLSNLLPRGSIVVANEVIRLRASILKENVIKWGGGNTIVTHNDPQEIGSLHELFDLMVIDAPCSGEGMFRKDPDAINEWSADHVQFCAQRQRRILKDAWQALKPGGYLVYSTCTFNEQENEKNLEWLAAEEGVQFVKIPILPDWGIQEIEQKGIVGYRFYPHRLKGEGLFMALLRKEGAIGEARKFKKSRKPRLKVVSQSDKSEIASWLSAFDSWELLLQGEYMRAVPVNSLPMMESLQSQLNVIHSGFMVGQKTRKAIIPHHQLAMSQAFSPGAFDVSELDQFTALKYLSKEAIEVDSGRKGWRLAMFNKQPLGWMKNLGNRVNNAYPKEWRIRMNWDRLKAAQWSLALLSTEK